MNYTLTESESKTINIGDRLYFINEGAKINETTIDISEFEVIGKIINSVNYIQYFLRIININSLFPDEKTYEKNNNDLLHEGYFKTKLKVIDSIKDELAREQEIISNKYDELNQMYLAINPLTYTTKSKATNSPPYKYNRRDGSVE